VLNPITAVPATGTQDGSVATQVQSAAATGTSSSSSSKVVSTANPSYVLDLGLGLVVLQYHDNSGDVISSIPTERQLQAYRDGVGTSSASTAKT
jgi:hypothetical protein